MSRSTSAAAAVLLLTALSLAGCASLPSATPPPATETATSPGASAPATPAPTSASSVPATRTPPAHADVESSPPRPSPASPSKRFDPVMDTPSTWPEFVETIQVADNNVMMVDALHCLKRSGTSWEENCTTLLQGFPTQMHGFGQLLDEGIEKYGQPRAARSRTAIKQARGAADYSERISRHAIEQGCLADADPQKRIPRLNGDGVKVPCVDHFTPIYYDQYFEALATIHRHG